MTLVDMINTLTGEFWSRKDELINEIEEMGTEDNCIAVVFATDEFINVANYDTDEEITVYLGHAGNTIWIEKVKEAEI